MQHEDSSDEDNSRPEVERAKIWGNKEEEEIGQEDIEEEGPDAKKQRAA